ncbi:MAG: spore cortex biosynthesis protein YabQ [Clostridia bacterium]|nr:spore cortex biosynthesis protein YabQ [Clostridia bacterium]
MITVNPLTEQLLIIQYAAIAGAGLGMLYDVFRILRWKSGSRLLELLLDFLFSIFSAGVLFVVATSVTQLRLRGFLLMSLAAGWILWNAVAGRLFRWILEKIWKIIRSAGGICLIPLRWHRKKEKNLH